MTPQNHRKTILTPPNDLQFHAKCCQDVVQDGSFHGTKDGVCGSHSWLRILLQTLSVPSICSLSAMKDRHNHPRNTRFASGPSGPYTQTAPQGGLFMCTSLMVPEVILVVLPGAQRRFANQKALQMQWEPDSFQSFQSSY